jgi:hypothetical protein
MLLATLAANNTLDMPSRYLDIRFHNLPSVCNREAFE